MTKRKRDSVWRDTENRKKGSEVDRSKGNSLSREGEVGGGKRQSSVMSAGCCGTKKQKTASSPSSSCNGTDDPTSSSNNHYPSSSQMGAGVSQNHSHLTNGHARNGTVAHPEMGFYCFDILYSHLHSSEPPKTPRFTNDE